MKKQKTNKPFFFKEVSHQEVIDSLNKNYPIKLKYNEDLIIRISNRYPFLDKSVISFIVKNVFEGLRDLLFLGKILNFNKLFFDTKIILFDRKRKGSTLPSLKVKMATPPPLRKLK